jgi:hypothetical protein
LRKHVGQRITAKSKGSAQLSIPVLDIEMIAAADLEKLRSSGVREGISIEYKRDLYSGNDEGTKEFLKDVTAFANTVGGDLIIGVSDVEGVADALTPVAGNVDTHIQRFENLIRDAIQPRLIGVQVRPLQVTGGTVIVLRVPRSWTPPHRVSFKGHNKFYVRNSAGVHEADMNELRNLFALGASVVERTASLRDERLALIESGNSPATLVNQNSRLVLHIAPFSALAGAPTDVDLAVASTMNPLLLPIGVTQSGMNFQLNFEGYLASRPGAQSNGYTQLFRSGVIEAVKVDVVSTIDGHHTLPLLTFEEHILRAITNYVQLLRQLGVPAPLSMMISLQNVRGVRPYFNAAQFDFEDDIPPAIRHQTLKLPTVVLNQYGSQTELFIRMKPAIDSLWNTIGRAGSAFLQADGSWQRG